MRYLVLTVVLLHVPELAAQEEKLNTLTPEEAAQGWLLLFDGKTPTELIIDGDVVVDEGVLVVGGARTTRVQVKPLLGSNYELRLEYRTGKSSAILVKTEWRGFMSGGGTARSLERASKDESEWIELRYIGRYNPAANVREVTSETRAVGEPAFRKGGTSGGSGDHATTLSFEVAAGSKLYLRNVKLKTDPVTADVIWVYLSAAAIAVALLVAVLLVILRKRAGQGHSNS